MRPLAPGQPQADASAAAARETLPRPLTALVGREAERADIKARLTAGTRLLTLTGPGGVGKTRLALAVAADLAGGSADGVVFVPLAAVPEAALVVPALASALGVRETLERPLLDAVIATLRGRRVLVVLDNLEHVLGAAPEIARLLAACPELTILATSRSPLRISGEQRFPTPPLALPPLDGQVDADQLWTYSAISLFVERAREIRPDFTLTPENAPAIADICQRLDGLPLAIELAAAWMHVLTPKELLNRLEPRLPLLRGGGEDQPVRLRTMRDAIAWSYGLLTPAEQTLFSHLSVFVGGFTLDAAEAVRRGVEESRNRRSCVPPPSADTSPITPFRVSDTLDILASLVDKSLVQRTSGLHGQTRYAMVETVREFGLEALATSGEAPLVHDAHAAWCLAFAARAEPELSGPDYATWVVRIEGELGNIRAAHAWLRDTGDAAQALRLGGALGWFWSSGGHFEEGRRLFAELIAMPGATEVPAALAKVLHSAGDADQWQGYLDQAQAHFEQALAMFRGIGDQRGVVAMLRGLGSVAIDGSDLDRGEALLREVLALAPEAGALWERASAASLLGIVAYTRGDYAAATELFAQAKAEWQELDDSAHVATAQVNLARAALASDDLARAAALIREVLACIPAAGDEMLARDCFEIAAGVAEIAGEPARTVRLLAASDAIQQRLRSPRWPAFQAQFERMELAARRALGDQQFASAKAAGRAMLLEEATAEALAALGSTAPVFRPIAPVRAGPDALTARELDVLRHIVAGLSDKEIAAELGIGARTVATHVATLRAKLGAPSRSAAAAIAVRDRLV